MLQDFSNLPDPEVIFETSTVQVARDFRVGAQTCVFAFSGFPKADGQPQHFGARLLPKLGLDVIFISAKQGHWWQTPDINQAIEAAANAAKDHRRRVAYGAGMGGFGAMLFAQAIGCDLTLAMSPQTVLSDSQAPLKPQWREALEALEIQQDNVLALGQPVNALIMYDPRSAAAAAQVAWLDGRMAFKPLILPFVGSGVMSFLKETGSLRDVIGPLLNGEPVNFRSIVRTRRADSATYKLGRAAAEGGRRDRMLSVKTDGDVPSSQLMALMAVDDLERVADAARDYPDTRNVGAAYLAQRIAAPDDVRGRLNGLMSIASIRGSNDPRLMAAVEKQIDRFLTRSFHADWQLFEWLIDEVVASTLTPRFVTAAQFVRTLHQGDFAQAGTLASELPVADLPVFALTALALYRLHNGDAPAAVALLETIYQTVGGSLSKHKDLTSVIDWVAAESLHLRGPQIIKPRYRLAIVSSLKNEGDHLEEWLAYHAAIGVEAFYLYDNGSTDQTRDIAASLASAYNVILVDNPYQPGQTIAFRHFFETHRLEVEWVAIIDGDEFLRLRPGDVSMHDFLHDVRHASAVALNWANFGSNDLLEKPDGLCIEAFTRRAPDAHRQHRVIKSIVRPDRVARYVNPHRCLVVGPYVDAQGQPVLPVYGTICRVVVGGPRINHYIVKSHAQFVKKKARGRPIRSEEAVRWRKDDYFVSNDRNDVEDLEIVRFASQVRERMSRARS